MKGPEAPTISTNREVIRSSQAARWSKLLGIEANPTQIPDVFNTKRLEALASHGFELCYFPDITLPTGLIRSGGLSAFFEETFDRYPGLASNNQNRHGISFRRSLPQGLWKIMENTGNGEAVIKKGWKSVMSRPFPPDLSSTEDWSDVDAEMVTTFGGVSYGHLVLDKTENENDPDEVKSSVQTANAFRQRFMALPKELGAQRSLYLTSLSFFERHLAGEIMGLDSGDSYEWTGSRITRKVRIKDADGDVKEVTDFRYLIYKDKPTRPYTGANLIDGYDQFWSVLVRPVYRLNLPPSSQ